MLTVGWTEAAHWLAAIFASTLSTFAFETAAFAHDRIADGAYAVRFRCAHLSQRATFRR